MNLLPDLPLQTRFEKWSARLSVGVIIFGLLVLVGWAFEIDPMRRPVPSLAAMNPLTSICFILLATAVMLTNKTRRSEKNNKWVFAIASFVFLLGLIKILSFFINMNFQVDEILFGELVMADILEGRPNSMAPNTAIGFMISSLAIWLSQSVFKKGYSIVQALAVILGLLGWLSVLGYLYRVRSFYGMPDFKPMSLYTAIAFVMLSLSILFSKPSHGLMRHVTSTAGGSVIARLLLPAAVIVPTVLAFGRLYGDWAGLYSSEFGVAMYAMVIIIIFILLIGYTTVLLNKRDVERLQSDQALRESEEQISAIFKAAPDAIVVIDAKGRVVKWNPEAEKLFQWPAKEITGKLLSETIIPRQFREAHSSGISRFGQTGESKIIGKTIEIQAMKKDNTQFDISLRVSPMVVKDDHMFVGFIRDITDRKKIEQKLKSFNEELSMQVEEKTKEVTQILERLSDAFIAVDRNFNYTYMNKTAGEMTRRDPAAIIGKNIWEEFPEAVGSLTYQAFHIAMKEQRFVSNIDYFAPFDLWQENNIYPSPHGLSVFIRDITKKKQAELALKMNEERYRTFVEEAVDAILVVSPSQNRYVEANKRAAELLGYTVEEILALGPEDIIVPDPEKPIPWKELEAGKPIRVERFLKRKDGSMVEVETSARKLPDGNYLAFVRDITQRKDAEKELVRLNDELRKLTNYLQSVREEERTHIAREIHDELGQQLTVLKMDIAWLNKRIEDKDEQVRHKIAELLGMIDTTVKTVRRISSELRPSLLDDLGLIPALEWHLEEFERRSGIRKNTDLPADELHVPDDLKIGLFRIFQESLTNVARHSGAKNVNVSLKQNNKTVILTIRDDGKGYDADTASQRTLGILGMKERTLMLGGEYSITGTPGSGTTVEVVIPLNNISH